MLKCAVSFLITPKISANIPTCILSPLEQGLMLMTQRDEGSIYHTQMTWVVVHKPEAKGEIASPVIDGDQWELPEIFLEFY